MSGRTGYSLRGTASKKWPRPQIAKDPGVTAVQSAIKQLRGEQLDKATYLKRLNQLLKGVYHGEHQ